MSAKIIFVAATLALANAGFLATPTLIVPSYGRESTTVYQGSSLAYRPNLTYRAPQNYQAQIAVTTAAPDRSNDAASRELSTATATSSATSSKTNGDNSDLDSNSGFSYSYNLKEAETGRARTQSDRMDNIPMDADANRRNIEYNSESRVNVEENRRGATTTTVNPLPTAPAAGKIVLVTTPTFYHSTPVAYHGPVAYDTQLAYHEPVAKVISNPVTRFAYSTSQISYNPTPPPTLLEDCLTCPQS